MICVLWLKKISKMGRTWIISLHLKNNNSPPPPEILGNVHSLFLVFISVLGKNPVINQYKAIKYVWPSIIYLGNVKKSLLWITYTFEKRGMPLRECIVTARNICRSIYH